MTPLERKAHLTLQGQSLLDEWDARCKLLYEGLKLWAEGDKLQAEGRKLYDEGDKLWAEGHNLRREGNKLWGEASKLYDEGHKFRDEGHKLWANAVHDAGLTLSRQDAATCTLSNGEIYHDTTRA